ncbi:MAG TPA: hypothetical protein VH395_03780 [Jatrophihabitantaceae bacterium]|jgi:hypothetical protein
MAEVTVDDGQLVISLSVPERVFSLHGGSVIIPLEQVGGVRVVRNVLGQLRGLRTPGASVRGRVAIGTWRGTADGRAFRDFVLIRQPGPGVVITTSGEYDRVLLDSDEPHQLAARIGRT